MAEHADLERLRSMFAAMGDEAEDRVGLLLTSQLQPSGYDATPADALAFAHTGGDGVHFSFLPRGPLPDRWPVLMTVPMRFDWPNLVVGATFTEFLSLGLRTGYFELEQLAYDRAGSIAWLDEASTRPSLPEMAPVLDQIAALFGLAPWTEHDERLVRLQTLMGAEGDNRA